LQTKVQAAKSTFDIRAIKLLGEGNAGIYDWDLERKPAFLIGKSTAETTADIDLSDSAFAAMIENAHVVLNRAANRWYVEDISMNGTVALEQAGLVYRLEKGKPCILSRGDILHIAKARLLCV
jgi:hypothetical protein